MRNRGIFFLRDSVICQFFWTEFFSSNFFPHPGVRNYWTQFLGMLNSEPIITFFYILSAKMCASSYLKQRLFLQWNSFRKDTIIRTTSLIVVLVNFMQFKKKVQMLRLHFLLLGKVSFIWSPNMDDMYQLFLMICKDYITLIRSKRSQDRHWIILVIPDFCILKYRLYVSGNITQCECFFSSMIVT